MSVEKDKIMDIVIETKNILDTFLKHLMSLDSRIEKIENQIS